MEIYPYLLNSSDEYKYILLLGVREVGRGEGERPEE